MARLTKQQRDLLTEIDSSGGSIWSGAWEGFCTDFQRRTLDSLLERGLIDCWRTCEDTEYYMTTRTGRRALIPHYAANDARAENGR